VRGRTCCRGFLLHAKWYTFAQAWVKIAGT
jgi:hypothetical protein